MTEKKESAFVEGAKVFGRSLVVGGAAAALSKTIVAPIERVKIILQVQKSNPDIPADKRYKGIMDTFVKLIKEQPKNRSFIIKPFTYWRGNLANVLRYFPMQAINFAFKSRYKAFFLPKGKKFGFFEELVRSCASGGAAGATGLTFVYPLDFARTRLTADVGLKRKYNGIGDCLKKVIKSDGFTGIYRGFAISIAGIIPYRAAYFGGYDMARKYVKINQDSFWQRWAVSQTTSVLSQYVAYPFDTVRRRLQMGGKSTTNIPYKSTFDCWKRVLVEEGFFAFYEGAMANAIRATGAALVLVFYDTIGKFIFLEKDYGSS